MEKSQIEVEADLPWIYNAEWRRDKEGRIAWIKSLKVGDSVCYTYVPQYNRKRRLVMTKVAKITPMGKVRLANGELFDYTGYTRVGIGKDWAYLEPYTDAHAVYVTDMKKRVQAFNFIKVASWESMPTETLERIKDILVSETLRREAEERERK